MTGSPEKVLVIVGPTASGKSAVAEAIADIIHAQIVSADSMQIYRGMDIATDKPSAERRGRYRYHLLDIAEPDEFFTVVRYRDLARKAIDEIAAAGSLPIVVGGSGLYVRAVIDDLDFPPSATDDDGAERLRLEKISTVELCEELSRLDPEAARRIHPNNRRRLIRALEFVRQTGKPFSDLQRRWRAHEAVYDVRILGLRLSREAINRAIGERVEAMLAAGLVEEARRFVDVGTAAAHTSRQALGHKELAPYLAGDESLDQASERLKTATRRYAKRQMTWFRRDERIVWIDVADRPAGAIARTIVADLAEQAWLGPEYAKVDP